MLCRGSNRSPGWVRRAGQPGSGGSSQHQARVIPDASALLHPSRDASHIVFHHVWLRYHPGQPHALSDVSFSVPRGHRVAIIGRTGSGKSSLFALLLRLYRPSEGRILLGGEDLSTMSPAALREAVGSVSHAPVLLSGSVRDNLDPEAKFDDHELVEVLRATQLWDPLVHAALGAGVSLGTPATNQLLLRSTTTPRPR